VGCDHGHLPVGWKSVRGVNGEVSQQSVVVDLGGIDQMIGALGARGFQVLGPVVHDGTISVGELRGVADLPAGWRDVQGPGTYRLEHDDSPELFGWAVGQGSVRTDVFPSRWVAWRSRANDGEVQLEESVELRRPTALFGIRPCDVAALGVTDRVFARGPDPLYLARRARFVVTAECSTPSGTCFCTSMETGPSAHEGYDLALMELLDEGGHRFLVRVGSQQGSEVLSGVETRPAADKDVSARAAALERARRRMGRQLETEGLADLLARNLDHPRWSEVADRCLACGNCTLVCPTCFCATVQDTSTLDGTVERERIWASCFDLAHSYMHGGAVRESKRARYRQWMTHKLSTWWDQFGTSGCIGCGRCITWCPVGIDITEECAAIRATDGAASDERGES
jgi:ferredoxin